MPRRRARTRPTITVRGELEEAKKGKLAPQCRVVYEVLIKLKDQKGESTLSEEEIVAQLELESSRLNTVQPLARIFQYYRSTLVRLNVITVN